MSPFPMVIFRNKYKAGFSSINDFILTSRSSYFDYSVRKTFQTGIRNVLSSREGHDYYDGNVFGVR